MFKCDDMHNQIFKDLSLVGAQCLAYPTKAKQLTDHVQYRLSTGWFFVRLIKSKSTSWQPKKYSKQKKLRISCKSKNAFWKKYRKNFWKIRCLEKVVISLVWTWEFFLHETWAAGALIGGLKVQIQFFAWLIYFVGLKSCQLVDPIQIENEKKWESRRVIEFLFPLNLLYNKQSSCCAQHLLWICVSFNCMCSGCTFWKTKMSGYCILVIFKNQLVDTKNMKIHVFKTCENGAKFKMSYLWIQLVVN